MPSLSSPEQLSKLREGIQRELQSKQATETIITVGMGTCGLAAGAGDTYRAIQKELDRRSLAATLRSVGCIGMCVREPLVDIQLPGSPRITYANMSPGRIPRLVEEHLVNGQVIQEWVIGYVPTDW